MSVEMPVSEARTELGPVTNRVAYGGETVYLTKHGRRAAALAPVGLRIGWLAGSAGAIRLTALPVAPLAAVRATVTLRAAIVDSHGDTPACSTAEFWPHVSIAYSNTAQSVAPIVARIEALRHLPAVDVLITSLALVELRRGGRAYRWKELEQVGLDG